MHIPTSFFMRKITTIRYDIDAHKSPINDAVVLSAYIKFEGQLLTKLAPKYEACDIIIRSPSNSCKRDPFPTYLLKEVLEYLLPLIKATINKSLVQSKVPLLAKRPILDHS